MSGHFTNDELIDLLYALKRDESSHLTDCAECARRFDEMRRVRAAAAEAPAVANEFLAGQRREIYTRLGERSGATGRAWIPALGAAALLAIGMMMYRPVHPPAPAAADMADAKLFSDVYSMEQADEPTVAAPLHSLFEDNQP